MASSGMLHRVALVGTNVLEEPSASIIRVTRIGELGTRLAVTTTDASCEEILSKKKLVFLRSLLRLLVRTNVISSSPILVTLMKEVLGSSETLFLQ
jgi:hypothetical protein